MDLLCINFIKLDSSKDGEEDVLVLTDAFSKYSQSFVTVNQKGISVTKLLMDKWFSVNKIPVCIHIDKGHSFENKILEHFYAMYGIRQSTTISYNLHRKSQRERLINTLHDLLLGLSKEQKQNWYLHLSTLVYTYNSIPHSTTGFQPYEFMFSHKAPIVCNAWLWFAEYKDQYSQSTCAWVDQQCDLILSVNSWALKYPEGCQTKHNPTRS